MKFRPALAALALPIVALAACQSPAATPTTAETTSTPTTNGPATPSAPGTPSASVMPTSPAPSATPTPTPELEEFCVDDVGLCFDYSSTLAVQERDYAGIVFHDFFLDQTKVLSVFATWMPAGASCSGDEPAVSLIVSSDAVPGFPVAAGTQAHVVQAVVTDDGMEYLPLTFIVQNPRMTQPGSISACELYGIDLSVIVGDRWRFSMANIDREAPTLTKEAAIEALQGPDHQAAKEIILTTHSA